MKAELKKAIEIVNNGGVIIYATDTACGIGCRIDNIDAVKRIFSIKGRDIAKATPVLFSSIEMVKRYVSDISPDVQERLMEVYWPGALTIVLKANEHRVHSLIRGGGDTIGVRIPNAPDIIHLIEELNVPFIGTSANFSGEQSIYTTDDIPVTLSSLVDYVLPGNCSLKQPSTVIDCTKNPWEIIRSGSVTITV